MDHLRRVVVGLGSNVGDRAGNIDGAVQRLAEDPELRVMKRSPLYETPPAGGPPQGDYLNGAVLLVTSLDGRSILERALAIERDLGRTRPDAVRWGPRTIDLDVLWIEGEWVDEPGLVVPHPRLRERGFALVPLLDIAPDASDPRTGEPLSTAPAALESLEPFEPG